MPHDDRCGLACLLPWSANNGKAASESINVSGRWHSRSRDSKDSEMAFRDSIIGNLLCSCCSSLVVACDRVNREGQWCSNHSLVYLDSSPPVRNSERLHSEDSSQGDSYHSRISGQRTDEQSDGPKRGIGRFLMGNLLAPARSSGSFVDIL